MNGGGRYFQNEAPERQGAAGCVKIKPLNFVSILLQITLSCLQPYLIPSDQAAVLQRRKRKIASRRNLKALGVRAVSIMFNGRNIFTCGGWGVLNKMRVQI